MANSVVDDSTTDRGRRRRVVVRGDAAALVAAGLALTGHGLWIHAKAALAQALLSRAFAATLAHGEPVRPWPWADTWPVARLSVPRLRAEAIVLAGSHGQALAFGPGQLEGTPPAGERGVTVFAAHRDTHFDFLKKITPGDTIIVTRSDGRTIRYRAGAGAVVRFDAAGIDPLAAGSHLVLATCWPFDAVTPGPLRYLLWATPTSNEGAE